MTEILPVIYDIAQPTPISLKELSAIAVSLEIWCNRIREYRMNGTIEKFDPLSWVNIPSKFVLPDLPSSIYDFIDEYLPRFGFSAFTWLTNHNRSVFQLHRNHKNSILEVFDDFILDYNGTFNFARTAERMMYCDGLSEAEKFAIACTYFFEDDIRRIWPSVCERFDLNSIDFGDCPQLYYWICCLRNETNKIPNQGNSSVDKVMLDHHMVANRPSLEYFWNRVSEENRMRKAIDTCKRDTKLLVTFVLSKLNSQQLDEFANTNGVLLILELLKKRNRGCWLVLPAWWYIRDRMNESTLEKLVVNMLKLEGVEFFYPYATIVPKIWLHHSSEIWNSVPPNLKPTIVKYILSDTTIFEQMFGLRSRRFVGFLLTIISCGTFEQRSAFWHNCWVHLIEGTRSQDLSQIMKLCFKNEEEIAQFKDNILAESENVRLLCSDLLSFGMLDELNDLVDFCWREVRIAKTFKKQLLRSTLVDKNNRIIVCLIANNFEEFRVFIDDVVDNADEWYDFQNLLTVRLSKCKNLDF
ncbi:uncharacterized protein LOC135847439 [Planococcus citri]|uniref:uncharacterized protein LOC135847439 n=1 Tax=Planococcus citri TaxID=170843 RepID=UPI0031F79DA6